MAATYTEISRGAFEITMMSINAVERDQPVISSNGRPISTHEVVFESEIIGYKTNTNPRATLLIWSGFDKRTGSSRVVGKDSIKVQIVDNDTNNIIKTYRINRSSASNDQQDVLQRLVEKCREAWRYALNSAHHCHKCGHLMKERKRHKDGMPFLGCVRYPNCNGVRDINSSYESSFDVTRKMVTENKPNSLVAEASELRLTNWKNFLTTNINGGNFYLRSIVRDTENDVLYAIYAQNDGYTLQIFND